MGRYLDLLKISENGEWDNLINLINSPEVGSLGFLGAPPPTSEKNQGVEKPGLEPDNVARFRWLIHFTDCDSILPPFSLKVTHTEALAIHADAVTAEQYEPPPPTLEPMTAQQDRAIRDWLGMIDARGSSPGYSSDQTAVDELVDKARHDVGAREYFLKRAASELPSGELFG